MTRIARTSFAMVLALFVAPSIAAPPQEVTKPLAKELAAKVSVDVDETTLASVARTLEDQSSLKVWVHPLLQKTAVSLMIKDTPLTDVLEQVRQATMFEQIDWDINGRVIQLIPQNIHDQRYSRIETYDVSSFLLPVVNYGPSHFSEAPTFDLTTTESGATSIFSDTDIEGRDELQDASRAERTMQIMDLIRNAVTPNDWRSAGGMIASMQELNGMLVISGPPRVHEGVGQLLDMLSDARQSMVVLHVQLLAMPTKKVDDALAGSDSGPVLEPAAVKRLMQNAGDGRRVLARTSMTCVSGQRIGTTAGGRQAYTRTADPVIVTGAVAHSPYVETMYSGLAVIVQPTINRNGRSVDVNIEANATQGKVKQVRRLLAAAQAAMKPAEGRIEATQDDGDIDGRIEMPPPIAAPGMASVAEYDLPEMDIAEFRSRARIANGGALMLVAVTGQGQMTAEGEALVLLIQPRIVKASEPKP